MTAAPILDTDAILWSAPESERAGRPLLILLHGYGSDERDLFGLTPHLPGDYVFAAVRAPLAPPFPTPGWSWYPIEGLNGRDPELVTAGADALIDAVERLRGGAASVSLLGFSQGGAIAIEAMRRRPQTFAFAVSLAGYATPHELPTDTELAERRPPVFWGRGALDDVIPAPLVEHTVQWLPAHVELSGRVYPHLGHAVSPDELADVIAFLRKHLPA